MGFIYKIEVEGELYIGSTKQKLSYRQSYHNRDLKKSNSPLYRFCREHNVEKIICELIEEVEDSELVLLEQEYIKMLEPSLNTRRAFRTEKEYLEQKKKYNQKKSICPICGLEMRKHNINRHKRIIHKS